MHRRTVILGAPFLLMLPGCVTTQRADPLPPLAIRETIAAAARFARLALPARWPGAPEAAFIVLLVGAEHEYLFFRDAPPGGFTTIGDDSATGALVHRRPRQFDPSFLATFPAIDGIPTIVIGYPEATSQPDPADWALTLLHEHFHQRQYAAPDYYPRTLALDLSGGDETGMWMLDYAFPFEAAASAFAEASRALAAALEGGAAEAIAFFAARQALKDAVPAPDWRYLTFQVWQEGVARFAEIDLGLHSDRSDWQQAAEAKRARIRADLAAPDLSGEQRVAFYSYGAAEAMLLDRLKPDWRAGYFEGPLSLDPHFAILAS